MESVRMDHLAEYLADCAAAWEPPLVSVPGVEELVRLGGPGSPMVPEFAVCEVAAGLAISQAAASSLCADVLDLVFRLRRVAQGVRAGEVSFTKARMVARRTRDLAMEQLEAVKARVMTTRATARGALPVAALVPMGRLQTMVDQAVLSARADEDAASEQARVAESLFVSLVRTEQGATDMAARLASGDAVRLDRRLDQLAARLARAGDDRSVQVRRAVALALLADPAMVRALDKAPVVADDVPVPAVPDACVPLDFDDLPDGSPPLDVDDLPDGSPPLDLDDLPVESPPLAVDDLPDGSPSLDLDDLPVGSPSLDLDDAPGAHPPTDGDDASQACGALAEDVAGLLDDPPDDVPDDVTAPGGSAPATGVDRSRLSGWGPDSLDQPTGQVLPGREPATWDHPSGQALPVRDGPEEHELDGGDRPPGLGVAGLPPQVLEELAGLTSTVLYVHLDAATSTWCEERAGALTPEQARTLVGHSNVSVRPVLDLAQNLTFTGHVAPPRLREQLALLNGGSCTFPSCARRARVGDVDHEQPYPRGFVDPVEQASAGKTSTGKASSGGTETANTHLLCRKHHRAKTHGGWRVHSPTIGTWVWTSPAGGRWLVTNGTTTSLDPDPADHCCGATIDDVTHDFLDVG